MTQTLDTMGLERAGGPLAGAAGEGARAIDLRLIHGNIVNVPSQAYVLGVFDQVNPTGAARAVDAALGGTLSSLIEDRMFGGNLGEVSILPTPRQRSLTDLVVFIGLGPIGSFKISHLQSIGEQLIRVLVTAKLHSFTTVPISLNAGSDAEGFIKHFAGGLLRGLARVDPHHDFRRIDLVEFDDARYADIRKAIYKLRDEGVFRPVNVMVREVSHVSKEPQGLLISQRSDPDPIYVTVYNEPAAGDYGTIFYDVLNNRPNAAIAKRRKLVTKADVEAFKDIVATLSTDPAIDEATSDKFGKLVLEESVRTEIEEAVQGCSVIIKHDRDTARVPWEITKIGDSYLALDRGISRLYLSDKILAPIAPRKTEASSDIDVLIVGNPTSDLDGAQREAELLFKILGQSRGVRVKALFKTEATKTAILDCLRSGEFEVVHYAGHAFFDKEQPSRSGLLCAGKEVLSGDDIHGVPGLPWLIFCNACESGMMASNLRSGAGMERTAEDKEASRKHLQESIVRNTSLAEAFLVNGIPHYIGTYWEVGDKAAETFGTIFYSSLAGGDAIGAALRKSRQELRKHGEKDWANYMHYGWPKSRLRER